MNSSVLNETEKADPIIKLDPPVADQHGNDSFTLSRFADFEVPEVKEQEQPEKANRNDSFKLD